MANLFLAVLYRYRAGSNFLLHEFTLMPEHFHLLVTLKPGMTVEKSVQLIKGGFSFRAAKDLGFKGEIWQRGFSEHQIRDARSFETRRAYIKKNAVNRGLVIRPEEYAYCCAFPGFGLDPFPLDTRG